MEKISKAQVKLVKSLQQKKYRDELNLFVAEGEKCVSELSKSFELEMLIIEDGVTVNQSVLCQAKPVCTLSAQRSMLEQMSGMKTPQNVIGVFKKPNSPKDGLTATRSNSDSGLTGEAGLFLALDGVQDPGNLGTIIRTCDWFGVYDIFCSLDTADCFNPKVVQATMGALARVRLHYVNLPEWLKELKITNYELRIYGTLLDGKDMYEVLSNSPKDGLTSNSAAVQQSEGRSNNSIIVMGNEGNGISAPVRQLITHPIRIPSYNKDSSEVIESLNVSIATAIVLAEFCKNHT